jgi:hypothetical protein
MSVDRVDRLDPTLVEEIPSGGTSQMDRLSLLAVQAALAARGPFRYLEIGSYLGASLQSFVADPRCTAIVSIDRRDAVSDDERAERPEYPGNTTAAMLRLLAAVRGADLGKLATYDVGTDELSPNGLDADLCFIDAEHTNEAALRDARFCRAAIRDRGVIVFHDRTLVDGAIRRFLGELPRARAYPLAHELFVIELGIGSLLSDPRVAARLPRRMWRSAIRLRAVPAALALAAAIRRLEAVAGAGLLAAGAPRRRRRRRGAAQNPVLNVPTFSVRTFVTDENEYSDMVRSFVAAGFDPDAFVRHSDRDDDPYETIGRLATGQPGVRYPILCHQDVRADRGAGAADLRRALEQLDARDPAWIVAGNAGITRRGVFLRRLHSLDPCSGSESLPAAVVTLDENFLVFNGRRTPACSPGLRGFHLYGADVALHALAAGGGAYVIDFMLTHLSRGDRGPAYQQVRARFIEAWNERCAFAYVLTPSDTVFISKSQALRRLFGSGVAMASVGQARRALKIGR